VIAPVPGVRSASRPIRVLVVDDSALVRRILSEALDRHTDIEVVGTATDPYVARERIVALRPDVVTLDVEMPRMDGLSFLAKLMRHFPIPVIVVSSVTPQHSEAAMRALSLGAVDVIAKPGAMQATAEVTDELVRAVRVAARAKVSRLLEPVESAPMRLPTIASLDSTHKLIAIGASTGGTQAIESVLRRFPVDAPATVIVQHMPEHFTASFAKRLDGVSAMTVREARDGDVLAPGLALVAPGGKHLLIQASGARWVARVKDGPKVHHQRPAVDVTFQSLARCAGRNVVAALLTGMGADGAKGMLALREAGAHTIAQDEATCVVWGMPREAVKLDAAVDVLPLGEIASGLLHAIGREAVPA
jgi:two-component system, chemotaxis family, protein-glutamate methylesterase/glutaminase